MAREIFCLIAGPSNVVVQNQVIPAIMGESVEIVPAIANLLGFDNLVPAGRIKDWNSCQIRAAFT